MKKVTLLITTMLMSIGMAWADDYTGLLVTSPTGTVTYALSAMPKIVYEADGDGAVAKIYTTDRNEKNPVATITLQKGQRLSTQWGTYTVDAINGVKTETLTSFEKNGRKYFTGGKLIIVGKDGKLYDAAGAAIK